MSFDSTTNIRDVIYKEWYEERNKSARAAKREELRKQKEEEERQKKVRENVLFIEGKQFRLKKMSKAFALLSYHEFCKQGPM